MTWQWWLCLRGIRARGRHPFSRATLAVVLVSEHKPVDVGLLVLPGYVGHAAVAADVLVPDGVHLVILGVDGRDQEVIRDVLKVTLKKKMFNTSNWILEFKFINEIKDSFVHQWGKLPKQKTCPYLCTWARARKRRCGRWSLTLMRILMSVKSVLIHSSKGERSCIMSEMGDTLSVTGAAVLRSCLGTFRKCK